MLPDIGGGQRNRPRDANSGGSELPSLGASAVSLNAV
jgi:hypothetical protein